MIFRKEKQYVLRIKKKKGITIDNRRPQSLIRNLRCGSFYESQFELLTENGGYCFWIPDLSAYIYFRDENVDIYEKIN